MRILFLGDVVGEPGCNAIKKNLKNQIKLKKIDFVIVNGENAAKDGVGITEKISNDFFNCGVDVITTGNHIWDQKETAEYIDKEKRLLRPYNLISPSPGKGFGIFKTPNDIKIGVLNLMGNVFMKKSEDVFFTAKKFLKEHSLKDNYDFLIVDFHGEITSEKNAIAIGKDGILNDEGLRSKDEFVQHKILDVVGDLYLLQYNIIGEFEGYKSGHTQNNLLLKKLQESPEAWELISSDGDAPEIKYIEPIIDPSSG